MLRKLAEPLLQLRPYEEAVEFFGRHAGERVEDEVALSGRGEQGPALDPQGLLRRVAPLQLLVPGGRRDAPDGGELRGWEVTFLPRRTADQ
jgi:hypothetical protein